MARILTVHCKNPEKRALSAAIALLENEGIVVAPTETGYCFIGAASSQLTHEKFLLLRPGHPKDKPFSLLCKDISQVSYVAQLSNQVFRMATRLWPGPYTFILESNKNTPKIAAGPRRKTVGIRISSHPILTALINDFTHPLLVTSVTDEDELITQDYYEKENQYDSWWTSVEDICEKAPPGQIGLALRCDENVPLHVSTIIDFSANEPVIVRDGGWDRGIKLT